MEATPDAKDASFDLVVALGIYHNARSAEEWQAALAETARVLKPGGRAPGIGQRPVPPALRYSDTFPSPRWTGLIVGLGQSVRAFPSRTGPGPGALSPVC